MFWFLQTWVVGFFVWLGFFLMGWKQEYMKKQISDTFWYTWNWTSQLKKKKKKSLT